MRLVLLFMFLSWSTSLAAQSADAALTASIAAHGGAAVASVQTVILTGQTTTKAGKEPITISASLDGKLRVDYGSPVTRSVVTTSDGHFEIVNGKTVVKAPHDGAYAQLDMLSIFGLQDLAASPTKTVVGQGSIAGKATLRVQAATGRKQVHYRREVRDEAEIQLDAGTGLLAAISRKQFASESLDLSFVITNIFSDYRRVGGLVLPYRIDRYLDSQLRETILIDSIQINAALPAGLFER